MEASDDLLDKGERATRFALAHVVEPGDPDISDVVDTYGVQEVWQQLRSPDSTSRWARRAAVFDLAAAIGRTRACGARFLIPGDDEWPRGLDVLAGCEPVQERTGVPIGLWVRGEGDLGQVAGRGVAMVGSRASTSYGEHVALQLGHDLAASGTPVVSGAAYGIDAASHRGALSAGASAGPQATVAVLACGVDQVYPAAHTGLLAAVLERGLVVAELPPGEHPTRLRFLARNRLIAAMSQATLIVEAAYRSGARNTVTWAAVCQRPVMAVPGPVTSAQSVTPNRLIRDHEAELVSSVEDVRALLAPMGRDMLVGHEEPPAPVDLLDRDEKAVLEAMPARGSIGLDELTLRAALPVSRCAAELESLGGKGLVAETLTGEWALTHRHGTRRRAR